MNQSLMQVNQKKFPKVMIFDYGIGNISIKENTQNEDIIFSDDGYGNITATGKSSEIIFSDDGQGNISVIISKKSYIQPETIFIELFGQEYLKTQKDGFKGTFNQYLFYRDYT